MVVVAVLIVAGCSPPPNYPDLRCPRDRQELGWEAERGGSTLADWRDAATGRRQLAGGPDALWEELELDIHAVGEDPYQLSSVGGDCEAQAWRVPLLGTIAGDGFADVSNVGFLEDGDRLEFAWHLDDEGDFDEVLADQLGITGPAVSATLYLVHLNDSSPELWLRVRGTDGGLARQFELEAGSYMVAQ